MNDNEPMPRALRLAAAKALIAEAQEQLRQAQGAEQVIASLSGALTELLDDPVFTRKRKEPATDGTA